MFDNYSSIVWSTTSPESERLLALNDEDFLEELNLAFTGESLTFLFPLPSLLIICIVIAPLHSKDESYTSLPFGLGNIISKADSFLSQISRGLLTHKVENPPEILELMGKRASFPLRFNHATEYVKPRAALIGYFNSHFEIFY
jgi:2-polyprenyl-6-methoxyphenol hydroxylase-like FAD-dependent oxidoreductase